MNFKFTTAGESHGPALVAIVEGVPAGLEIRRSAIDRELWRRQRGYGRGGRMKIEDDRVQILGGIRHGKALGSPISLMIENRDFVHWQDVMSVDPLEEEPSNPRKLTRPRPGHADFAGGIKYQTRDLRNILERASARETAARVAAGAVAREMLRAFDIEVMSHVAQLGGIPEVLLIPGVDAIRQIGDLSPLRCVDPETEKRMIARVDEAKAAGDTVGGVFEVVAAGVPPGLGSHVSWNTKLDGRIAQAMMSIPAIKGVEIGNGFWNASKPGTLAHDEFEVFQGRIERVSNRAGGVEGGVTNGEELRLRGYMKPISTLRQPLRSVDVVSKKESDAGYERSDITAVPAAGVIGEAMLAIILADAMREKFGGDTIDEMRRNYRGYLAEVKKYTSVP
ncbi:MAG TPA: chorismate synthase [Pyrinomonadaceae bacterium]|nr:chorismate synthase [Pyrinomonadaceae bacterium]